jgi:serpin B
VSRSVPSASDLDAASTSTTAFGLDLLQKLTAGGPDANVVISPTSIATALAMLAPGARGKTAAEITAALRTTLPPAQFAAAVGGLDAAAQKDAATAKATLHESDSLWTQKDYQLQEQYLETLAAAFDTGVHETDFSQPEQARAAINALVAQQTDNLIKDLFPQGSIDPSTRVVLTDALYFKAKWENPFDPADTSPRPFHLANGSTAARTSMAATNSEEYSSGPGWQYTEVPYTGGNLAMGVLLPDAGTFDAFRKTLTGDEYTSIVAGLQTNKVDLQLPKFTFDYNATLNNALKALGMTTAFSDAADLGGIPAKPDPLQVSSVVHQAHVAVDEQGTTAAAATGVVAGATAIAQQPTQPVVMHVDRPFLFMIRDTVTGQVLFAGQVTDPKS